MNVSLTDELEEFVHKKVESGRYTTASEVVREGLRLLEERDQLQAIKLEELRAEIRKGLASGPSTPFSAEEINREVRAEVAKRNRRKAK